MLLLRLASGAIVPHAPLLLAEVNASAPMGIVREAARSIDIGSREVTILVTPHGARSGVYGSVGGDLASLGAASVEVAAATDPDMAQELSRAWGTEVLEDLLDHGATVALALLSASAPVVVCSLPEWTERGSGVEPVLAEADRLAEAIGSLEGDGAAVVATGHTSAALTPRAPLTERAEGHELAETVVHHLTEDPAGLVDIPASLWEAGGGCGAGPFRLLGRLFEGRPARLLINDQSLGVGYLVAEIA